MKQSRSSFEREMMENMKVMLEKLTYVCERLPEGRTRVPCNINEELGAEYVINAGGSEIQSKSPVRNKGKSKSTLQMQDNMAIAVGTTPLKSTLVMPERETSSIKGKRNADIMPKHEGMGVTGSTFNKKSKISYSNFSNFVVIPNSDDSTPSKGMNGTDTSTGSSEGDSGCNQHGAAGLLGLVGTQTGAIPFLDLFNPFTAACPESLVRFKEWHMQSKNMPR